MSSTVHGGGKRVQTTTLMFVLFEEFFIELF
jgi:hypothetical protein